MGGVLRVQFDKDCRVAPEVSPAAVADRERDRGLGGGEGRVAEA